MDFSELYGWLLGTFSSLVLAGIGFPIPEAVPVVAAGAWVGAHQEKYGILAWVLLPVCVAGIVIADCLLYGVGRLFGHRIYKHKLLAKLLHADKQAKVEENFQKYGLKILLIARILPSIPTVISVTAGMMRVSFRRFLLADVVYAIPGISLLFGLAFWFGQTVVEKAEEKVQAVGKEVGRGFGSYAILASILAVGLYFLYRFYRRPITTGDPKDLPLIGGTVAAKLENKDAGNLYPSPTEVDPQHFFGVSQNGTLPSSTPESAARPIPPKAPE